MADRFRLTKGWAQRFQTRGISVPTLLRRAGLPANLFEQEKIFVTTAQIFALWRAVAEEIDDAEFGLKLGSEIRFERSHPVEIAGICSRTFGDALERLARYKQLTCPEEIHIHRKAQETSVEFFFVEANEREPDIMVDVGLTWILNVGRRGSDGEIAPLRVELTRPAKNRELLQRHFGCPVRFNADRNALIFRSIDLDMPFVTQNEELATIIGAQLDTELKALKTSRDVREQVKETLRRSLAGRRPTLEEVAKELGMGARTLQRRLTDAGLKFQLLVEETRRELARHYLTQRAMEVSETAFLLGFEDANSFYRAFQEWEGTSPGEWRTRHGARSPQSAPHAATTRKV
jgi:AraC-like DNA-binding protein